MLHIVRRASHVSLRSLAVGLVHSIHSTAITRARRISKLSDLVTSNTAANTMITETQLRIEMRQLLPAVDLDKTTERMIREKLQDTLGEDLSAYKALIREEIDQYLVQQAAEEEATADEQREPDQAQGPNKKRKLDSGEAEPVPKTDAEYVLRLSPDALRYLSVKKFKGMVSVDIREFYKKGSEVLPGTSGISLKVDEWRALCTALPAIIQAEQAEDYDYCLQLAPLRKATFSTYKGKTKFDVREYYEAAGELKPSKKGAALDSDMLHTLADQLQEINAQVDRMAASGAGAGSSKASGAAAAAAAAAAKPQQAAAAAPVKAEAGSGDDQPVIALGGNKQASINIFKGRQLVDLREYYNAGGELKPGKKGISLSPDDWSKVCSVAEAASEAAVRRDEAYVVQLSGKRQLGISTFKGKVYVGIREYYEKDGKLLPGTKGLSMSEDQWAQLVNNMAVINQALGK